MNVATELYVLNRDLTLGRWIGKMRSFDVSLKWADTDTMTLSLPWDHIAAEDLLQPGAGLLLFVNGQPFPFLLIKDEFEETEQVDSLNLWAVGMDTYLQERLCLPNTAQPFQNHDGFTGAAEDAMKHYVDANLGPSAAIERRHPLLAVQESLNRGSNVIKEARFDNLLDMLRSISTDSQEMGFGIAVDLAQRRLVFDIVIAQDVSNNVQIYRNHRSGKGSISLEAPRANYVYTGDKNRSTTRQIDERGDTASILAWRRIEEFQDFSTTLNAGTLAAQGQTFLNENALVAVATFELSLAAPYSFIRDFNLGDTVRVWVRTKKVQEQVQQVDLHMDQSGLVTLTATVGTTNVQNAFVPQIFRNYKSMVRRVARQERL